MEDIKNSEFRSETLVPVNLSLEIRGLAFIYEKGGFANLRCPIVANHKLKLRITSGRDGDEFYVSEISIPRGALVEITNSNFQIPDTSTFDNVFKIHNFHGATPVKFAGNINDLSSLIKIEGVQLTPSTKSEFTGLNFEKWEILNHGDEDDERRYRRGNHNNTTSVVDGIVKFADANTAQTTIRITNSRNQEPEIPQSMEIRLKYFDDTPPENRRHIPHKIEITNLCNKEVDDNRLFVECDRKSDFIEYYQILNNATLGKSLISF